MSTQPLILLTNDDGYRAEGIRAAWEALEGLGELWMVAPERERSAVAHCISLHKPLRVREHGERQLWCSGTPTDCVYVALHHILPRKPALVVSGINEGANLAEDVTYSGTVAAALEGVIQGVPGVAASLTGIRDGKDFGGAKVLLRKVVEDVLSRGLPPQTLVNLNVPTGYDAARGLRVTKLGHRHYGRCCVESTDPRGRSYVWIGGSSAKHEPHVPGSDTAATDDGVASLTPLRVDWTEDALLDTLRDWPSTTA